MLIIGIPKIITVIIKVMEQFGFIVQDADGMANSEDPDQTAPKRAVLSGSTLIAQLYLSNT